MSNDALSIGIDFGTTSCSMAWYNPDTEQAEILLNAESEDKTPSLVYFGEDEFLVGELVEELLEDSESYEEEERLDVARRVVRSIKRNLLDPPLIPIPGRDPVRPVEVVAEILKKLKRDAEEKQFQEEVRRAVIACPAVFGTPKRRIILDAAALAGFEVVDFVEEAVAAAVAFVRLGRKAGGSVLVYDLGGGMFDLAVVGHKDGQFRAAVEPDGDDHRGGDDFDRALYDHLDVTARERLGRPIHAAGGVDPTFLRLCRSCKENLSNTRKSRVSSYLLTSDGATPKRFRHEIDRETFETLIWEQVEDTVHKTASMAKQARQRGHGVDTMVLIGGSSRVPLVERRLEEALWLEPRKFANKDYAVALGAAYYAGGVLELPARDARTRREVVVDVPGRRAAEIERKAAGVIEEVGSLAGPDREAIPSGDLTDFTLARTLVGHSDGLLSVDISRDGRFLASGSKDGTLTFWDLGTGEPKRITFHEGWVGAVAFAPDGKVFAGAGSSGSIELWTTRTGEPLRTLTGHQSPVFSVAFGPDGALLASGGKDETIKLWNPRTGELLRTVTGHESEVLSVAISPDGRLLASGSKDETTKLWDPDIGELLRTLPRYADGVYSVAFSPDGSILAAGRRHEEIELWDVQNRTLVRRLPKRTGQIYSLAFSPDGRIIAVGGGDQKIGLCDAKTGKLVRALAGHEGEVRSVAFSSDGRTIASGGEDNKIKIWGKVR